MKKNIVIAIAAILSAASIAFTQEPAAPSTETAAQPSQQLGTETIASLRKAYENGEYNDFLKQMENDYKEAQLSNLADFRAGPADPQLLELEKNLTKERNQALLSLLSQDDTSPAAQKMRSAATDLPANVDEAFSKLTSFRHLPLGSGANPDENQLIELDLAYEYKAIHVDLPTTQGQTLSDRREKHYVLKMEHMDKMVQASQNFEDASLKETIALAAANLDQRLAQNWDRTDLNALATGRLQPTSALEEKAISILNSTQEKFADLSKQLIEKRE